MTKAKVEESLTVEGILRCWRKYCLAVSPGTPVRHGTTGDFGKTVGPAHNKAVWQVHVQVDGGIDFDTNYDKLFPAWWPESQWPWYVRESQEGKAAE